MRTKTKALTLSLCAVLLVVTTVFATMAYLTSQDSVNNTFTVGKVEITLDEAQVNDYGVPTDPAARVKANTYKLIPGRTYTKDPTVHVAADSENCWLFVKVENGLGTAEATGNTTIAAQMAAKGWSLLDGTGNIYAYRTTVTAGADIKVFESFKIADNADVAAYEGAKINVTAYAASKLRPPPGQLPDRTTAAATTAAPHRTFRSEPHLNAMPAHKSQERR